MTDNFEKAIEIILNGLPEDVTINPDKIYYRDNLVKIGRSAMVIGAYAGIIIDVYFLNGTP